MLRNDENTETLLQYLSYVKNSVPKIQKQPKGLLKLRNIKNWITMKAISMLPNLKKKKFEAIETMINALKCQKMSCKHKETNGVTPIVAKCQKLCYKDTKTIEGLSMQRNVKK